MTPICNACASLGTLNLSISGRNLCDRCIGRDDENFMRAVNQVSMYVFKNCVRNASGTFVLAAHVTTGRSELAPDKVEVIVQFDHSVWTGSVTTKVLPVPIVLKRVKKIDTEIL